MPQILRFSFADDYIHKSFPVDFLNRMHQGTYVSKPIQSHYHIAPTLPLSQQLNVVNCFTNRVLKEEKAASEDTISPFSMFLWQQSKVHDDKQNTSKVKLTIFEAGKC